MGLAIPSWVLSNGYQPRLRQSRRGEWNLWDAVLLRPHLRSPKGHGGRWHITYSGTTGSPVFTRWAIGGLVAGHSCTGAPDSLAKSIQISIDETFYTASQTSEDWTEAPNVITVVFRRHPGTNGYSSAAMFQGSGNHVVDCNNWGLSDDLNVRRYTATYQSCINAQDGNWHVLSYLVDKTSGANAQTEIWYDGELMDNGASGSQYHCPKSWFFGSFYRMGTYTSGAEFLAIIGHSGRYLANGIAELHTDPFQVFRRPGFFGYKAAAPAANDGAAWHHYAQQMGAR